VRLLTLPLALRGWSLEDSIWLPSNIGPTLWEYGHRSRYLSQQTNEWDIKDGVTKTGQQKSDKCFNESIGLRNFSGAEALVRRGVQRRPTPQQRFCKTSSKLADAPILWSYSVPNRCHLKTSLRTSILNYYYMAACRLWGYLVISVTSRLAIIIILFNRTQSTVKNKSKCKIQLIHMHDAQHKSPTLKMLSQ